MKNDLRALVVASLVVFSGCADGASKRAADSSDPLILRTHFIGSTQLFADPGGAHLKEVWSLPGSLAFRNEVVDKFSRLPAQLFAGALPKGAADHAAEFRPLLEDLLASESYSDFRAGEMVLAVRLNDARSQAWDAALKKAFGDWKLGNPAAANADGFKGWEVKRSDAPKAFRFGRAGDWTVVAAGPETLGLAKSWIGAIKTQGRPAKATGAWLEGDANLARFDKVLPIMGEFDNAPIARFSISNRADFVRTLVKLDFPKPHNWKSEPWRIPTNAIFDPLCSFVAARGVAPIFDAIPEFRDVGWKPTPNQYSGWGLKRVPLQFYYAIPHSPKEITNDLRRVAPKLQAMMQKEHPGVMGKIVQTTNDAGAHWEGLPLAVPRVSVVPSNSSFVLFETFPLAATKSNAPPELFQQLAADNVVYYGWEITQDRVPHWRQMYQLAEIATGRELTPTNAPSWQWISDITPKLGEAVTLVTTTSPQQMTLVRKSHTGLTAFELVSLGRWLESTNFPAFGVFAPAAPSPAVPKRSKATTPPRPK